jgi:hypothetical protein
VFLRDFGLALAFWKDVLVHWRSGARLFFIARVLSSFDAWTA